MNTLATFSAAGKTYAFHDVRRALGTDTYGRLPYVARVLAENILRHLGRPGVTRAQLDALADPSVAPDAVALPLHVDAHASADAEAVNLKREFERNGERYQFLKWAERAFKGLRVFPPGAGI